MTRAGRLGALVLALAAIVAVPHADVVPDRRLPTAEEAVATLPVPHDGARRTAAAAAPAPAPAPEVAPGESVISAPAAFDAPAEPPAPPPAPLRGGFESAVPSGGVWAVMIGINDYPGRSADLRSAVRDARHVDQALARYGVPAHQRLLLLDRQASASTIRRSLDWLVAHAGADATAVLFYAGHARKVGTGAEALVAADGRLVADHEVAGGLAGLRAHRTWIALGACYSGGFTEVLGPGRILTAAAGPDDLAYETSAYGHSYLVEYMIRRAMIQRAAPDSVEAAFAWAVEALERDHPNRVPVQYDQAEGDLRLGDPIPAPPPRSTRAPEQEKAPPSPDGGGSSGGGSSGGGDEPPPRSCAGVRVGQLLNC